MSVMKTRLRRKGVFLPERSERFSSVPSMFGSLEVQILYTT